jgi:hypothetical protein
MNIQLIKILLGVKNKTTFFWHTNIIPSDNVTFSSFLSVTSKKKLLLIATE